VSRTSQIRQIIDKRHPLAERVKQVEANLTTLAEKLRNLENHRDRLLEELEEDATVVGRLRELNLSRLQEQITTELDPLAKLRSRFARHTLNIGVVGRARQGKSRFLQSLSGLTTAEIPDGDLQHCTGVRSTIHHSPHVETYGEVWFYTEPSFLNEVISPYYEHLNLGRPPRTVNEFIQNPLPPLPETVQAAEAKAKYEHLCRYHENFDKYGRFLRQSSPLRIPKEEIRNYVAQDTPEGDRIYNYMAVREVKIVCNFPNPEVGQIALVDTPGLGDTGIGDEERLVKTIGNDVDVVLFVRMPKPSGDYWADVDVRLYDIVANALKDVPLSEWSFMILNRTEKGSSMGDNYKNCQQLYNAIGQQHIDVVDCSIKNCSHQEEANEVLDRTLDYLADSITELDRKSASACQERLQQLQDSVNTELEKAKNALGQAKGSDEDFSRFLQLFRQLWKDMTNGLQGILQELREKRDDTDNTFKEQVESVLEACRQDTGLPQNQDEIERRQNELGGYPNAYYQYLNEIRAYLSQHFLSLDKGLKRSLLEVKSQVAQVLAEQAHLKALSSYEDYRLLDEIAERIPNTLEKLKFGFQILSDFDISYRGLIQHRIRLHLDKLTPNETQLTLSKSPSAKEVLTNLKTLHAEAVYECETALEDLLCEPSQAEFAIVEEFIDRVLRAEGVYDEWQIFLQEERFDIWPEEFQKLAAKTRLRRKWQSSIEDVESANSQNVLQFIK